MDHDLGRGYRNTWTFILWVAPEVRVAWAFCFRKQTDSPHWYAGPAAGSRPISSLKDMLHDPLDVVADATLPEGGIICQQSKDCKWVRAVDIELLIRV